MSENRCHCQNRSFLLLRSSVWASCCCCYFSFVSLPALTHFALCSIINFRTFYFSISPNISSFRKIRKYEWNLFCKKNICTLLLILFHIFSSSELFIVLWNWLSRLIFFIWNSLCKCISMAQQRQNEGNEWHTECVWIPRFEWKLTKVGMKYDAKGILRWIRVPVRRYSLSFVNNNACSMSHTEYGMGNST